MKRTKRATGAIDDGQEKENKSEDEGWAEPRSQRSAETVEQGDEVGELRADGAGGNERHREEISLGQAAVQITE